MFIRVLFLVGESLVVNALVFLIIVFFLIKFSSFVFMDWGVLVDKISFLLLNLLFWLIFILIFFAKKYQLNNFILFKKFLLLLGCFLFLAFILKDLIGFYIFFEISLIPLAALLAGWGYQVERVQAMFYLFMYTIVGSLPLLFIFLYFFLDSSLVWAKFLFQEKGGWGMSQTYMLSFVCFRFFIKLPAFGLHLWLPKAHVEAPVRGSIILAALLLKISIYGVYRIFFILGRFFSIKYFFIIFLLWGSCLRAVVALRQRDIKSIVAYSSVSHIGGILVGLFFIKMISFKGALIIILAHGFCSSALFYLANVCFEKANTRQIILARGQIRFFLNISYWWFLFLVANFSAPPFLSLFGEIMIFVQRCQLEPKLLILLGGARLLVARFCVFLFSRLMHGKTSYFKNFKQDMDILHLVTRFHIIPLLLIVFSLDLLSF